MGTNERVIAQGAAVGLAMLAAIFVLPVYLRWY